MSSSSPSSANPSADIDTSRRRNRQQQQPGGQRSDDDDDNKPKCYLIITNISKKPNVRSLLLLAAAFGCTKVFVAGQKKFDFSAPAEGSSSTDLPHQLRAMVRDGQMDIVRFDRLDECIAHIKSIGAEDDDDEIGEVGAGTCNRQQRRRPIRVVGVEIDPSSQDVEGEPFEGDTAFMMGNEGQGMNEKQMSLCDGFVKIAQYGGGTASLNVYVAASIVLHRFHHWTRGDDVRRYCDTT